MHEILFRGRCEGGPWLYGSLLVYGDGFCEICVPDGEDALNKFRVDPETVGQYTGLTDKNGKKIFEGDVVSYRDEFGVIEYHEGEAMFVVSFDTWLTDFDHICGNSLEIIGNIHDSPELLGGAENG